MSRREKKHFDTENIINVAHKWRLSGRKRRFAMLLSRQTERFARSRCCFANNPFESANPWTRHRNCFYSRLISQVVEIAWRQNRLWVSVCELWVSQSKSFRSSWGDETNFWCLRKLIRFECGCEKFEAEAVWDLIILPLNSARFKRAINLLELFRWIIKFFNYVRASGFNFPPFFHLVGKKNCFRRWTFPCGVWLSGTSIGCETWHQPSNMKAKVCSELQSELNCGHIDLTVVAAGGALRRRKWFSRVEFERNLRLLSVSRWDESLNFAPLC